MYLDTLNVMGVEPVDKGHSHELSQTMGSADGSTQTITCEWMQTSNGFRCATGSQSALEIHGKGRANTFFSDP